MDNCLSGSSSNELVERLCKRDQEVSFEDRVKELDRVEERVNNGFVFVKFTQTKGGTEIGIDLIPEECDFSEGNFKEGTGMLHLVGTCELNYCKVKCIADVDLATRKGFGRLELR